MKHWLLICLVTAECFWELWDQFQVSKKIKEVFLDIYLDDISEYTFLLWKLLTKVNGEPELFITYTSQMHIVQATFCYCNTKCSIGQNYSCSSSGSAPIRITPSLTSSECYSLHMQQPHLLKSFFCQRYKSPVHLHRKSSFICEMQ